jgi:hypothetical protein
VLVSAGHCEGGLDPLSLSGAHPSLPYYRIAGLSVSADVQDSDRKHSRLRSRPWSLRSD